MKVKKFKKCRRFGSTIYEKCASAKYALSEQKRKFANRGKRPSEYGLQLIEKQKLRLSYVLKEKKLRSYIFDAINSKDETYQKIYENLETRLDNVIYRLGLAESRSMARQMVSHGHFTLNGRKFNISSYAVKVGDKIAVREGSKDRAFFREIDKKDLRKMPK
ncbi:30S ribosomal protein S4 [sediment metagenome]|uniref:30S ribosomal protein S4 n=1 Tax=sediment metagenome TaxID=749907 RepID=D9PK63_9ZZZZ